ncbi:hypothetical protein HOC01_06470 [archaeon]|nr:hypothetical protein [archaeon]MBT6697515.1 hypothetical protein [archaeon]
MFFSINIDGGFFLVDFGNGNFEFETGYASAMDREGASGHGHSAGGGHHDCGHDHGSPKSTGDVGVTAGDFGTSFGLGPVPNLPAAMSKIHSGQKTLELSFFGMGKGNGQGHTAGMYGKKQRQALREKARANRVDWTLHTSVGVSGLAGKDRQGNFSKEQKVMSIQEIKRAIEFAADVAEGGPVVVHTGEFDRPVVDASWNKEGKWAGKFEMYDDEAKRGTYDIIDTRTGSIVQQARKGKTLSRPLWKRYSEKDEFWGKKGNRESYKDENGQTVRKGDYIDYWGNKLERAHRVPIWNKKEGIFEIEQLGWDKLESEAKEMTRDARAFWREYQKDKNNPKWKSDLWYRFREAESEKQVNVMAEEAYIISSLETNAANSRAFGLQYSRDFEENVERMKKLEKAKKMYLEIERSTDEKDKWRLEKELRALNSEHLGLVAPDKKLPSEIIDKEIRNMESAMKQAQDAAAGQWSQAEEQMETARNIESGRTYALKEAYDAYGQAGVYAWRQSEQLKRKGKLKKNLMVAMENLFPEAHGAHPDEIIELVTNSRRSMAKQLRKNLGYDHEKAAKAAEKTISMTFDVGHMNMWRKYFKDDPMKQPEDNDKDFQGWMLDMTAKLAKAGVVGHVHLDDNYGYQDEHLAPGEGIAPIKEMVKILKDNGYKGELIVEPGADFTLDQGGWRSVQKTWDLFGAKVTGTGKGFQSGYGGKKWSSIHYNHQGMASPPYFVFGGYSPSEDWTLWTGVPLE